MHHSLTLCVRLFHAYITYVDDNASSYEDDDDDNDNTYYEYVDQTKIMELPPYEVNAKCPYCNYQGRTEIDESNGTCVLIAVVLLVVLCWPLFWIPLCFDCGCKNIDHYCKQCNRKIGYNAPYGIK